MDIKVEPPKPSLLLSAGELLNMDFPPEYWIVNGLLCTGRKRINLLVGRPREGKSTLALQLCVAVTKGEDWLGRPTTRSEVIFWQTENEDRAVQEALQALKYDAKKDEQLLILRSGSSGSAHDMKALADALRANPNVRLVVLETADSLLNLPDNNNNSDATKAFDRFDALIGNEFATRVCFVGLHHLKKRETSRQGDMVMGASNWLGRTDGLLYIRQVSDADTRRTFHTDLRRGKPVPRTYLDFDEATQTSVLGKTLKQEKESNQEKSREYIKEKILKFYEDNPNMPFNKENLAHLPGRSDTKRDVFYELVKEKKLVKSGKGVKGAPLLYRSADVVIDIEGATVLVNAA